MINNVTSTHLISETTSAGAVHRNFLKLSHKEDGTPVSLQFTETFSKAKNPDEHRVRFTLFFDKPEDAERFYAVINRL